jgi:signal transduction histidine kinase/ActR/RegA family two-component response regulator
VQGRKKDGTIFPMDLAVGELPPSGERREFVGTIRDISERKTLERQLQQAQKMEAVGQLTGGVAHDFNNLLAVILGNLDMLQEAVDDPKIRALADAAMRATQRGSELTQRLLAFSRRQMLQPEIIDINVLVSGMVDLLARAIGEDIQVRTDLSPVSLCAKVDPGQLENSLLNLAVNARDAMPDGGALTLETSDVVLDSQYAERSPDVTPGSYVMLAVSDTGTGMPPEVALRAFEPFFTTKEVGKGSGLGLSMVYGFVKQSGGHVTIYSEPGHGTTVKIYFPLVAGESAKPMAVDDANIPLGQGETVLVVEDDPDVRDLAIALLRQLGYTVIEASDGHKALALLADNPEIDLLLSDIVLPRGMSGAALAERVHKKRPNMPVLYMSGYAADSVIKRGIIDRGAKLISKPFRKAEIARKVHQALEERKTK